MAWTASATSVAFEKSAFQHASRRALRIATLGATDLLTLSLAVGAGFAIWSRFNPFIPAPHVLNYLAAPGCAAAFAFEELYPGFGMTAVENIRRMCKAITFTYVLVAAALFLSKEGKDSSRGLVFTACLLSMILAPLGRWLLALSFGRKDWWTVPVVILGAGETAAKVIRNLAANRVLGYRPVVCLDDDLGKRTPCEEVPVVGTLAQAQSWASRLGAKYAIVAMPNLPREQLLQYLRVWSQVFPSIMIVPDLFGVASLWTAPRDLGGVLGLEIQHNLLNHFNRYTKRALDITLASLGLIVTLPLLVVAGVWIKIVSPGAVLYRQEREGRNARVFHILKLRTMYPDAERVLENYLQQHEFARLEWARYCKLRNDPRILPGVGTFLRKTSLDEVPQLWNVVKGDMSLVGPRPFPRYHNERFDPEFRSLRTQVPPGLTGLWQVSARSNGDLGVQASLDDYYIRNWSLWLDVYILIRTTRAVIAQNGAF